MKLRNFLFIHIPRTGVTYFEKLLGFGGHDERPACGNAAYPPNHNEIMGWDKQLGIMLQHATYSQMLKHKLYKPEEKLTTVSIIRDPYQRTVSLFKYFGGHKKWGSFNNFLRILSQDLHEQYFYYPQYRYLFYEGELAIENLIRFENYQQDMQWFSRHNNLNLEIAFDSEMQKEKTENNLKKYYKNPDHIKMVNRIYARDFEFLGYPHLQTQ